VAVAVLALWNWQQWRERQASETQLQSLQQDIRRLEAQYGDRDSLQGQRLQALEDKLAAQRELIAQQQRQIDHNARALLEAGHRTRTDWLLAEAEYLLRIANQRLQVEKDIGGALAALTAADEVLAESDDIGVYPVRQQLAREQLALKSIEPVDRTGLYLTLEAAIDSINRLTDQALIHEAAPGFLASTDDEVSTDTTADGPLGRAWQRFKNTLAQVVVVRRLDEPVKPLLSPDQSAYARLNLQLMLEEAEMAVLRGNQALYERALAKTRAALADWYHPDHPPVAALNDTLADLAGRDIAPELPDISQSLRLLKQRLAGRLASPDGAPEARAATGGDAS
jgi:uroporphyrin-3 C-methyltransferase